MINGVTITKLGGNMKFRCHNCGSTQYHEGMINNVFEIEGQLHLVKNIPAIICDRCEEKFFKPETYEKIYDIIHKKELIKATVEADVYEFA